MNKEKKFEIQPYGQQWLDEIVDCWNESLVYDPISRDRFIQEVVLDDNFDRNLALVLLVEGRVRGFCLGIKRKYPYLTRGLEEQRGWISCMFVHPEFQRQGYGQKILEEEERRLAGLQTEEITLCAYSPNYFTPGVDKNYRSALKFFEKNGYVRGVDAVSMERELFSHVLSPDVRQKVERLKEEGIMFRRFTFEDGEKLLDFVGREFDAGWVRNVREAMKKGEAERTILIAVDKDSRVVGYCMRKIDGRDARFGPIGVAEALRSKGLGGILLELQMAEMKKQGIYHMYFLWTHGAAMRFYERHGLKVYRTYQLYRKSLKNGKEKDR